MTSIAQTLAGSSIAISAGVPATYDAPGFSALSYTAIAEISDLGTALGKKYNLVVHNPVADRQTYKFKAGYDNGTLSLKMASDTAVTTDAGQTILRAAAESDSDYTFVITVQDGAKYYFTAKTMSFLTDFGTISNILMASAELQVNSDILLTV